MKIKTLYIWMFACATLTLSSCNDWLDVKGDTEMKEKDMFAQKQNFNSALVGCYMTMAQTSAYGYSLSFGDVEELANHWVTDPLNQDDLNPSLAAHKYTQTNVKKAVASIYSTLFNAVVQANTVQKNIKEHGNVIDDAAWRKVIEGETYAIRAFCQFDILRLFGQMPMNAQKKVSLPYAEEASISVLPPYYSFEDYVKKLEKDIDTALTLLKDNDPIFKHTFAQLLNPVTTVLDEEYAYYRQTRLNYWAVKALQARMYLYVGNKAKAHQAAMDIINATYADGTKVIALNTAQDIANTFYALPSDCLFYLDKFDLKKTTETVFPMLVRQNARDRLAITSKMLDQLFAGVDKAAHNRYQKVWKRDIKDNVNKEYASPKKYFSDDKDLDYNKWQYQAIPMLRLSEMYLIAMETTTDLNEANTLLQTYMRDHNILEVTPFENLESVAQWVFDETRRELFAEGQMFFAYKRTGQNTMLWNTKEMTEADYIIPLPETEFDPNAKP